MNKHREQTHENQKPITGSLVIRYTLASEAYNTARVRSQRIAMSHNNIIEPLADYPRPVGADLWRMQDSRSRTLEVVRDWTEEALYWQGEGLQNSLGTLLYHLAIVEMDWLYEEVLQQAWSPEIKPLFPYAMRDSQGLLYTIREGSLQDHLVRLEKTRRHFLEQFKSISLDDYYRARTLPDYDVTPEWVLYHLIQHEDEHRGEIQTIRTLYEATRSTG